MISKLFNAIADTLEKSCIRTQLSTGEVLDAAQFWHDAESTKIPMIVEKANNSGNREVTFLWRSKGILQGVYIRLNRVTDKKDVKKGLMTRIPSTDIWTLTLELPASYRGSYSFIEIPSGMTSQDISQLGGRFSPLPGRPDPFNKAPEINIRGFGESVLSLDLAPEQNDWGDHSRVCSGVLSTSYRSLAGRIRRVRFYLPEVPASTPLGLLVLPDAEIWFDRIDITKAIDIATNNARIAPMAVLGIDNISESDRLKILGGNKELILDVAGSLIPEFYECYPDIVWAGRSNTILAGQSLGGVTALMAALYAPEIFGTVISQSPSMWWSPDRKTPVMFTGDDISWVSKLMLSRPPKDVHIRLSVGSLEGTTVLHVCQLHQLLLTSGVKSELSVYMGGHDYAWWRGALIDALKGI
ncbi:alpha/beta hydrolase-fold protein [Raoultella sp. WB_B2P2-3]